MAIGGWIAFSMAPPFPHQKAPLLQMGGSRQVRIAWVESKMKQRQQSQTQNEQAFLRNRGQGDQPTRFPGTEGLVFKTRQVTGEPGRVDQKLAEMLGGSPSAGTCRARHGPTIGVTCSFTVCKAAPAKVHQGHTHIRLQIRIRRFPARKQKNHKAIAITVHAKRANWSGL